MRKHFNIKGSVPRFSPTVFNTLPQGLLENIKARLEEDLIISGPYDEGSEARRQSTINCVCKFLCFAFQSLNLIANLRTQALSKLLRPSFGFSLYNLVISLLRY